MTFIKSEKNSTLLYIALAFISISMVVALIMVYNQTVNLKHGITDLKSGVQQVAAETASLKDKVFTMFDPQKVDTLAKEQGLIKEIRPNYLEVSPWVLASHL